MIEKIRLFMKRLEQSRFAPLMQFIKFGMVGVSNTLISFLVEMICYYGLFRNAAFGGVTAALGRLGAAVTGEQVRVVLTTLLAFIISVTNSFVLNSRFVFRQERRTAGQTARAYGKTVLCYALTGVVLAPALRLWMGGLGIPYWAASLLSLIVTIPLNFLMNKFWAFASRDAKR